MINKIVFLKFNTIKLLSALILFLFFLFFSCVEPDINIVPFVNINNNVLVKTSELTSSMEYPNGSIITEIGLDQNNNNILDPEEITSTTISIINNDNISNTLVLISDESVGLNCENGGQAINTGEDINGNNVLDVDEIISTQFVCNNSDNTPNLTIVSNEISGSSCLNGGVKIENGIDSNLNQILDDSEIESTSFICDAENLIDTSNNSSIRGVVRDASTDLPLENVTITISSNGQETITLTTDSSGFYTTENISDQFTYEIAYELDGYSQVIRSDINITSDTNDLIETTLLSANNNTSTGNIEGIIINAVTGLGEATIDLKIREGLGNNTGEIITTAITSSNGNYSFTNLNTGNYTIEISKNGFITTFFSVQVLNELTIQNSTISPTINMDEIRIVLEWGQEPFDLDNHLTGPLDSGERFHAYFEDPFPINSNVILNVDESNGFGPETITITETIDGVYRYSVHHFINNMTIPSLITLENSSAIVKLYIGDTIQTFNVPSGSGNLWTVFEINGSDLTVSPVNTITSITSSRFVQRGSEPQNDSHLIQSTSNRK